MFTYIRTYYEEASVIICNQDKCLDHRQMLCKYISTYLCISSLYTANVCTRMYVCMFGNEGVLTSTHS